MIRRFCFVCFVLVFVLLPGCAWFESACTKTLPVLATANVYLDDAQVKLDQAEAIVVKISHPEQRAKGIAAIAQVRLGLNAATAQIAAATTACTTLDVATAFAAFADAWSKLLPFISLLSGPNAGSMVGEPLACKVQP